jgi:hypothetical protein
MIEALAAILGMIEDEEEHAACTGCDGTCCTGISGYPCTCDDDDEQ